MGVVEGGGGRKLGDKVFVLISNSGNVDNIQAISLNFLCEQFGQGTFRLKIVCYNLPLNTCNKGEWNNCFINSSIDCIMWTFNLNVKEVMK